MMCAGFPGVDSCDGDSGGPMAGYIDGNYRLVGIISWGFGCGGVRREGGEVVGTVIKYLYHDV